MKKNWMISLRLTGVMLVICCVLYPLLVALVGKAAAGGGNGEKVVVNGKVVGYRLIGQQFTDDRYFSGRPSAVNYNAAGSGGSNKGPSNPEYLQAVQARIDSFLAHNPGIRKSEIPADLVTASGSGLDPDISPAAARIQVKRVARVRNIPEEELFRLISQHTSRPLFGPEHINVLELNISLDELSPNKE